MLRQCMYQLPFPPNAVTEDAVQRMAMAVEKVEIIESQFVLLKGKDQYMSPVIHSTDIWLILCHNLCDCVQNHLSKTVFVLIFILYPPQTKIF